MSVPRLKARGSLVTCRRCNGRKEVLPEGCGGFPRFRMERVPCPECKGTGKQPTWKIVRPRVTK